MRDMRGMRKRGISHKATTELAHWSHCVQGFSAMALAAVFSAYELAGVIVNLLAGVMGARWGIKTTLLLGLTFQLAALGMLFGWQARRPPQFSFSGFAMPSNA